MSINTSDAVDQIAKALAAAQAQLSNPEKNKTAKVESAKGGYSYNYADLADALDVIRKTLSAHQLSVVQATQLDGDNMTLVTRLMHSSGQWIEGVYPVCRTAAHQQMGAALTYARRYSLFAIVGVAGEDDTDGSGAASAEGTTRPVRNKSGGSPPGNIGFSDPDGSLQAYMLRTIEEHNSIAALNSWAKAHASTYDRLTPAGQKVVKTAMDKRRGMLYQVPADQPSLSELLEDEVPV